MKLEGSKIGARLTRKYSLDNYESLDIEASIVGVELEGGDVVEACYARLFNRLRTQLRAQALPSLLRREKQRRSELAEVVNALPKALQSAGRTALEGVLPQVDVEQLLADVTELAERLEGSVQGLEAEMALDRYDDEEA